MAATRRASDAGPAARSQVRPMPACERGLTFSVNVW